MRWRVVSDDGGSQLTHPGRKVSGWNVSDNQRYVHRHLRHRRPPSSSLFDRIPCSRSGRASHTCDNRMPRAPRLKCRMRTFHSSFFSPTRSLKRPVSCWLRPLSPSTSLTLRDLVSSISLSPSPYAAPRHYEVRWSRRSQLFSRCLCPSDSSCCIYSSKRSRCHRLEVSSIQSTCFMCSNMASHNF
jgi:hypothetical protein